MSEGVILRQTVPGFIEAWRLWRVTPEFGLKSLWRSWLWQPMDRVEAICQNGGDPPCCWDEHRCGIYAWKTREKAESEWASRYMRTRDNDLCLAIGRVRLWGRVIEQEEGWRAQYAYPDFIWVADSRAQGPLRRRWATDIGVVVPPRGAR